MSHILTYNPNYNGIRGPISQPAITNNRSTTVRINFDDTLSPTLLLHLGIGYIYTLQPNGTPPYD
jgi:hypothetical protein